MSTLPTPLCRALQEYEEAKAELDARKAAVEAIVLALAAACPASTEQKAAATVIAPACAGGTQVQWVVELGGRLRVALREQPDAPALLEQLGRELPVAPCHVMWTLVASK